MYHFAAVPLATAFSGQALADGITSFSQDKAAGVKVSADASSSFYCECQILRQGKKSVVDLESFGY